VDQSRLEQYADLLIEITRKVKGKFIGRERLVARLGIHDESLEGILNVASSWDYKLEVSKNRGIALIEAPDVLTSTEVRYGLKSEWLGHHVSSYRHVGSTNTVAVQLAESGAPEGQIVTAEEQRKGRGRFTRNWHSPTGTGIYMSIILRPFLKPAEAPGLSIMTAVALADTLEGYCPEKVQIKWPNDVLISGRKVAGILTELSAERDAVNHVIIGIGINVNQELTDFPEEIRGIATSVRHALRRKISRVELVQSFLLHLEKHYKSFLQDRLRRALPAIRRYSSLIGREITVCSGRTQMTGLARDIDQEGRLILETSDGLVPLTAGEVTIAKE